MPWVMQRQLALFVWQIACHEAVNDEQKQSGKASQKWKLKFSGYRGESKGTFRHNLRNRVGKDPPDATPGKMTGCACAAGVGAEAMCTIVMTLMNTIMNQLDGGVPVNGELRA
jgi:hypothetical protein